MLQKRLAWALFTLLLSTLVYCQPTELIWAFLFRKLSNFTHPPPPRLTNDIVEGMLETALMLLIQLFIFPLVLFIILHVIMRCIKTVGLEIVLLLLLLLFLLLLLLLFLLLLLLLLLFGLKKTGKLSIIFEDLSRNGLFSNRSEAPVMINQFLPEDVKYIKNKE